MMKKKETWQAKFMMAFIKQNFVQPNKMEKLYMKI